MCSVRVRKSRVILFVLYYPSVVQIPFCASVVGRSRSIKPLSLQKIPRTATLLQYFFIRITWAYAYYDLIVGPDKNNILYLSSGCYAGVTINYCTNARPGVLSAIRRNDHHQYVALRGPKMNIHPSTVILPAFRRCVSRARSVRYLTGVKKFTTT